MKLVAPFYLQMTGSRVTEESVALMPHVARVGRRIRHEDVVSLLRGPWRESSMGAWYSLFHDPAVIGDEVLDSLRKSGGTLNACALMVAAVELVGVEAAPSIEVYAENDRANRWGGQAFATAALQHLGKLPVRSAPTNEDCSNFVAQLDFARKLRSSPEASRLRQYRFNLAFRSRLFRIRLAAHYRRST